VIDLVIRLQGAGLEAALQRLVEQAFQVADEDGDGRATWKDAVENPRFRSGQLGNLVADSEEQREQLIRLYDSDRDGLLDREELPRFLTRSSGGGRSFAMRSSNEYRSSNRTRSPTRLLLDTDREGIRDGAITPEQMDAAPAKLLNRDADDDEVVILAELKNSIDDLDAPTAMMSGRRRTNQPDTAIWLTNPSIDLARRWGLVQFLLEELYSFGGDLHADDWPLTPELFRQMDTNGDGTFQRSELAKLLEVPPHLVIEVSYNGASGQDRGPRIKLRHLSSELAVWKPSIRELPTRISLQLPDVELEFFVNEDASLTNTAQAAKAQFMALDRDKNGYLEKSEVPEQIPGTDATFESFDADGDGKVYEADVVAYLDQRNAVTRSQIRARVADQEDALFTALDTDGDGRLITREIRESPARLRALDRNGDGLLQSHEIPGSMVVGFVRGNPQQDAQLFSGPAAAPSPEDKSLPRWFRGMDANADGEISRREFFGDIEQFERLDVNRDGFISREESGDSEPGANDQ
jgi:Ca2+-binding EF-hand superfamily protein